MWSKDDAKDTWAYKLYTHTHEFCGRSIFKFRSFVYFSTIFYHFLESIWSLREHWIKRNARRMLSSQLVVRNASHEQSADQPSRNATLCHVPNYVGMQKMILTGTKSYEEEQSEFVDEDWAGFAVSSCAEDTEEGRLKRDPESGEDSPLTGDSSRFSSLSGATTPTAPGIRRV